MSIDAPILVTGAAGRLGGVGGEIVEILRSRDLPVRALVRTDDDRAEALRATGAEVVIGDLTRAADVARALEGCRRMYFGMSVSAPYLETTVTAAAVARARSDLEVFVNISQLTVSQMSLTAMTDSPPASAALAGRAGAELVRLARGARPGDGLPPALLLLAMGRRIDREGRHDPPAVRRREDVAGRHPGCGGSRRGRPGTPGSHLGKVIELTGPRSEDMRAVAAEYSEALGRTITYVDVPFDEWCDRDSAHAVCRATSSATCGPWPSFTPTTAMIGSLTTSRRSPAGPRRVSGSTSRNTPRCSVQANRPVLFHEKRGRTSRISSA